MAYSGTEHHAFAPISPYYEAPVSACAFDGHIVALASSSEISVLDKSTGVAVAYPTPLEYGQENGLVAYGGKLYTTYSNGTSRFLYELDLSGTATLVSSTAVGYDSPLRATSGYLILRKTIVKISDGTSRTAVAGGACVFAGGGKAWLLNTDGGTTIYRIDVDSNSLEATHTLVAAPEVYSGAVDDGTALWFRRGGTSSTPLIRYVKSTGVSATPPLVGVGSIGYASHQTLTLHSDGYLYGVSSDRNKVHVVDPLTMRWATDEPVNSRGKRTAMCSDGGDLWIPSSGPNPWPVGWP